MMSLREREGKMEDGGLPEKTVSHAVVPYGDVAARPFVEGRVLVGRAYEEARVHHQ